MEMTRPAEKRVGFGMSADVLVAAHLATSPTLETCGCEVGKLPRHLGGVAPLTREPTPHAKALSAAVTVGPFLLGGRHPRAAARRAARARRIT